MASEFAKYLKRHFSFIHDFKRKYAHLKRSFPNYGTPLQSEMVGKLWSIFPNAGARLSNGKSWIGYYFYADPDIGEKGWFGFVSCSEIASDPTNTAELIIASTYHPELPNYFREVTLVSDTFIDAPGKTKVWAIEFDESWNNVDIWREKLSPFWGAIRTDIT